MANYAEIRSELHNALDLVKGAVIAEQKAKHRDALMAVYDALHRELAAINKLSMAETTQEYRALTLRFSGSASGLQLAKERLQKQIENLNEAAAVLAPITNLLKVIT